MRISLLTAVLISTLGPNLAQASLLQNGGFETGSFTGGSYGYAHAEQLFAGSTALTGWTVGAPDIAWAETGQSALTAAEGRFFLDLTGFCDLGYNGAGYCGSGAAAGGYGAVTQTIATVAGATYHLSVEGGSYGVSSLAPTLVVSAGASSHSFVLPAGAPVTGQWTAYGFDFVATAAATDIRFGGSGGGYGSTYYLGVDNASVELLSLPVPEPGSWALMAAGLAALAVVARRRRQG